MEKKSEDVPALMSEEEAACFYPSPMRTATAVSPPQSRCANPTCHAPRRSDSILCHGCHDSFLL